MGENGSIISKNDRLFIQQKLSQLEELPLEKFQKHLKAMGYLTYLFQKVDLKPIIVGGHAVELYTLGNYTTMDIDFVLSGRDYAKEILESTGFHKESPQAKYWYHEQLNIPIEIPDNTLDGSMDKVVEVEVEPGFVVFVIGIEDLILDRAKAATYWQSSQDREWCMFLMISEWDDIDFGYLESKAQNEPDPLKGVLKLLLELKQEIKHSQTDER